MRCIEISSNKMFAVKVMNLSHDIKNEIQSLTVCKEHKNIVNMVEHMKDDFFNYIVLEILEGGELYSRIQKFKNFLESDAKTLFRQLVLAVQFMHSKNIIHRDLKPENVMFVDGSEKSELKVVDFGFACLKSTKEMSPRFTLDYAAPESLSEGIVTESQDIWALGAILYTMLCGNSPFMPSIKPADEKIRRKTLMENIRKGNFNTSSINWKNLSMEVKDIIENTLCVDQKKRLTIEQILNHSWLKLERNGFDHSIIENISLSLKSSDKINEQFIIPKKMNGEVHEAEDLSTRKSSKLKKLPTFPKPLQIKSEKTSRAVIRITRLEDIEADDVPIITSNTLPVRRLRDRTMNGIVNIKKEPEPIKAVRTVRKNLKRSSNSETYQAQVTKKRRARVTPKVDDNFNGFPHSTEDVVGELSNWGKILSHEPFITKEEPAKPQPIIKVQHESTNSYKMRRLTLSDNGKYYPTRNGKLPSMITIRKVYLKQKK